MSAIVADEANPSTNSVVQNPIIATTAITALLDPLDADLPDDEIVLTTRRAICRVALVAAETAGRFQREEIAYDPMSWMLAERKVFDGSAAITACLNRDACMRGILVHGLGLGLDVDRAAIDALMAADDGFEDAEFSHLYGDDNSGAWRVRRKTGRATKLRLYTATIADTRDNVMLQAFHASIARSVGEIRSRLAGRYGPDVADAADIRLGLHVSLPLVVALVPAAVTEMITMVQRESSSPKARTFAVDIQQSIRV